MKALLYRDKDFEYYLKYFNNNSEYIKKWSNEQDEYELRIDLGMCNKKMIKNLSKIIPNNINLKEYDYLIIWK